MLPFVPVSSVFQTSPLLCLEREMVPTPPPKEVTDPLRVAFVFLAGFEESLLSVGMLHLHHLLGHSPGVPAVAERVVLPDGLLHATVPDEPIPLVTLETGTPLTDCDALVFSLSNPVLIPWMLSVLEAGSVPVLAEHRGPNDPVVIVGNHATLNPEPLALMSDLILVGEAEETLLLAITALYKASSLSQWRRTVCPMPGAYVPALYQPTATVGRAVPIPTEPGIPSQIQPVDGQDLPFAESRHCATRILPHRLVMAPNLGCRATCPFCQVGQAPYREAPLHVLSDYIQRARAQGATHAILHSLSLPQYESLDGLTTALDGLDITLGSMRADELNATHMNLLSRLDPARSLFAGGQRQRSRRLVLAPETADPKKFSLVGKRFSAQLLSDRIERALQLGFRSVMLYFMLGLPGETDADVAGTARLVRQLFSLGRKQWDGFDVKIMQFEAEPMTPLSHCQLTSPEVVTQRVEQLRAMLAQSPGDGRLQVHTDPEPMRRYRVFIKRGDRSAGRVAVLLHQWRVSPASLTADILRAAMMECGLADHDPLAPILGSAPWDVIASNRQSRRRIA